MLIQGEGIYFCLLQVNHGAPDDDVRHVGDLGNIETKEGEAVTKVDFRDDVISLYGGNSIINRAFVVHAKADDLGRGGDDGSLASGNAGARIACGLIQEEAPTKEAKVVLQNGIDGEISLFQNGPQSPLIFRGSITGLERGLHGFHVHENGILGDDCKPAGGHFNPYKVRLHGDLRDCDRSETIFVNCNI